MYEVKLNHMTWYMQERESVPCNFCKEAINKQAWFCPQFEMFSCNSDRCKRQQIKFSSGKINSERRIVQWKPITFVNDLRTIEDERGEV